MASNGLDRRRLGRWAVLCVLIALSGSLYGCAESSSTNETADTASSESSAPVSFEDVTADAPLDAFRHQTGAFGEKWFPETMGSGGGFLDYNGDGRLDILLVGGGVWEGSEEPLEQALRLYRNEGDGAFTNVTEEAGLGDVDTYGFGIVAADYDNDGDSDFLLTTLHRNLLFRNDGDGSFTEIGREAGLTDPPRWSSSAIFFDADNDGHLDLYVGNYVAWSRETDIFCSVDGETKAYCTPEEYEGRAGRFYHNNGDGTFSNWTDRAGFLPTPGKTLGVTMLDYNRDGWTDLYVANDMERNLLYENDGDGTFTERGTVSGVAYSEEGRVRAGMGTDAGVVDSTGEPTIFVGNFSREMIGVYRHLREGLFKDRASASQVGLPARLTLAFGLFLFDVELDGALDLFVANGHVQPDIERIDQSIQYRQAPQLFLNSGNGTFEELDASSGPFAQPLVARGAAYGDVDRDGDLDLLVTENEGGAHLWRNDARSSARTEAPYYLRVDLVGVESNRNGIGAQIEIEVDGRPQKRLVRTGSSYLSQTEITATFGLGKAGRIDRLTVRWPSGQEDHLENLDANQTVQIVEGEGPQQTLETVAERSKE